MTKTKVIDKIEILEDGVVQVREVTRAYDDDGSLIGERYARWTLVPGQDVSAEKPRVRKVCGDVWDAATLSAYQAKVSAGR